MIKYFFSVTFILFLSLQPATACTTFFINQNGQLLFGRNYDWVSGSGMVHTNLRGLAKTSFPMREGKTISWISKYGSITFNQYGKEFPTGGMNEKGLVVELMWLDETRYPVPDSRPAISVLQWIQYQLDNCATVEQVLATDKIVRIASVGTTPLHYLIADKQGNAATIEFLNGQMIVHQGKDLRVPVLTNNTYKESALYFESASTGSARNGNSLERFAKACSMVQQYNLKTKDSPVDYSFDILREVAQRDFTKWSIVYDIKDSKIYFRTNSHQPTRSVSFGSFNFACTGNPTAFNINTLTEGDVSARFSPYSSDLDLKIIQNSFLESGDRISVPAAYIQKINEYPAVIRCK